MMRKKRNSQLPLISMLVIKRLYNEITDEIIKSDIVKILIYYVNLTFTRQENKVCIFPVLVLLQK